MNSIDTKFRAAVRRLSACLKVNSRIGAVAMAAAIPVLATALKPMAADAQSVTVSVNWNTANKTIDPLAWGTDNPGFLDPANTASTTWMGLVNDITLRKPLIRIHGWGMVDKGGSSGSWLNADGSWNATKIGNALRPVINAGYTLMINIPDGPNNTGGGAPDPNLINNPGSIATWAANLVRIVNVDNGFGVKYWEIPNEREGSLTTGQMATLINQCSVAMKAVDPTIKVGGPATSWINGGYIGPVVAACGTNIDYVTCHAYAGDGTAPSPQGYYNNAQSDGSSAIPSLRSTVNANSGGRYLPIYLDEYNICWQSSPYNKNSDGAVYDVLEAIGVVHGGGDGSQFWELSSTDDWHSLISNLTTRYPISNYMTMFNQFFYGSEMSSTTSNASLVDRFAAKNTVGGTTTYAIVLINRSDSTQTVGLTYTGFTPTTVNKYTITSAGFAGPTSVSWPISGGLSMPARSIAYLIATTGGTTGTISINSAGPAASPFVADVDFSGGNTATNWTGAIDTTAATNPAPQAVYQSERYGNNTYTIGGLTPSTNYTVRLHFCENFFTASGQRTFNVTLNGTSVLANFDIFAQAGAIHKAITRQFTQAANGSGQIVIAFSNVVNNALANGVEVLSAGSPPPTPTGLTATAGNTQVALSWGASTGATAYDVKRSTVSGSGYAVISSPATTSYTNTGLTNGTTYYYVVAAKNANGSSANSAQASATPQAVPQAQIIAGTATIDGTVDAAWSGATAYSLNKTSGTISSGADLSATWKGMWDSTNLYILADVTDDVKKNDSASVWDDDAVEVYLDADHNGGTVYDANDRQIELGWGDAAAVEPQSRGIAGVTFAKADPTGTTYRIEAKIPWAIESFTPASNAIIGIDVHVDDDDDGGVGDGKLIWNDGTNQAWTNPSLFGAGKLNAPAGPAAPTGLTATQGNTQVALSWTASSGATSYNVKRSTVNGSGYATVASPATTSYTNTGLANGTQYYYVVTAVNAGGESGNSNQASATPTAPVQINCGGAASAPYNADANFTGGTVDIAGVGHTITTTGITNPAPQLVYQYLRWGAFTYTIGGLHAGSNYTVRLHFSENWWTAANQRKFNVLINGTQVLTNFDIFATAGAQYKAVVQTFTATGNASGQVVITTTVGSVDNPSLCGVEVY
jgi:fibronectin type 3 domain-containing protein